MNKYPEYIMEMLRQRLGLEEDDTSRDAEINSYSSNKAFEEVLVWEGFIGYARHIKMWIADIYGIDLDVVSEMNSELNKPPREIKCSDCSYHWAEDENDYPSCHYTYGDGYAPCEVMEQKGRLI